MKKGSWVILKILIVIQFCINKFKEKCFLREKVVFPLPTHCCFVSEEFIYLQV